LRTTKDQYCIQQSFWNWCSACTEEDCHTLCISYTHRDDHQLPDVLHCHKHQVALSGLRGHCGFHAEVFGQLALTPPDNFCPSCDYNMGGYNDHFNDEILDTERTSIEFAYIAHGLNFK